VNGPSHGDSSPLTVSSPDLPGGSTVPREFTCDGANRVPRLWSAPPLGTRERAVEMLGPDAPGGTFTHWLVYGLPAGIARLAAVPAGAAEGVNDFGRPGYGGPCPPRGPAHHYHLVVLALDTRLGLESRIHGHVLATGELVATCQRA
jgi:Raf kinase inhibitor-like YbhB/YbcL family protein